MSEFVAALPAILGGIGVVVTAVGVILIAWWSYKAKVAAEAAVERSQKAVGDLVVINREVRRVGDAIDGRLTKLLDVSTAAAHAEGKLEEAAEEKARQAAADAPAEGA